MSGQHKSRFSARPPVSKPVVIIISEGTVTELQYFKMWYRQYRTKFTLLIPEFRKSDPTSLVERAIEYKLDYSNPENEPIVWCVGDQDNHANLSTALRLAHTNGIKYALSIPCLELWFVLHFEDQTGNISTKKIQSKCRRHLKEYGKTLTEKQLHDLLTLYETARSRAIALEKWHREKFTDETLRNPSSNIWNLVDELKNLGR